MKLIKKLTVLTAVMLTAGSFTASAQDIERAVPESQTQIQLSYAPLVREAAPAVVNIYTKQIVRAQRSALFDDPLFQRFFGDKFSFGAPQDRVRGSLGSGVIVRPNGVIVTNHHVIEGADEIRVVLADRREFDAKVVLDDARTDLAILRINAGDEPLQSLPIADSDGVQVGDLVLAIGNPFGIGQTVTSGIVSANARTQEGISDFGFFIQTDAAVNPGNSGGALVGMNGELLGINTAIYSRTGASNGIGFAIPANMVKSVLRAAMNEGSLVRPWLGIRGQSVTADLAAGLGLDRAGGVLIDAVYPGGPAEAAGLVPGDVIMAVGDKEIIDEPGLNFRVATQEAGEAIELVVLSRGSIENRSVNLSLPPEEPARNVTKLDGRNPFQGVTVGNLSPRFNDELQIDTFATGVIVLEVERRTPAARYQFLLPGDIIRSVNGVQINTVADLTPEILENQERYVYQVRRRGGEQQCEIIPNRSYRCTQAQ
ncbi:MAG: Do family serine endopeptidase [Alphaproteobacteria bacterium]|nr:MAG: Do family serine endopeptidase [Alphaproteobacteria bacterium]